MFYYPLEMGTHYREQMREHEERKERERLALYGPRPLTEAEKIAEIRAELDGLASRLRADLLADLRAEIEKMIASATNGDANPTEKRYSAKPSRFSNA